MKKYCCFLLSALLLCSFCGCSVEEAKPTATAEASATALAPTASAAANNTPQAKEPSETAAPTVSSAQQTEVASTPVPPSANKEVVTEANAPKEIYWNMTASDNLTYHLKDCPTLKGSDATKIDWEMVTTIGLRQCPKCNPPQYEGYVEP